jgi:hypothetical protein
MSDFKSNELDEIFQKLTTNLGVHPRGTMHDAFGPLQTASSDVEAFDFRTF